MGARGGPGRAAEDHRGTLLTSLDREHQQARNIRESILVSLGKQCEICGRTRATWHLDHIDGCRTWNLRSYSRVTRMKKYLLDFYSNRLRILCESCNTRDGARRRWKKETEYGQSRTTTRASK